MYTDDERLQEIGRVNKEIESTGYALKSSKMRFALNNRDKIINLIN